MIRKQDGKPVATGGSVPVSGAKRLLICADWFAPGMRAGGPIRSIVNLVRLLADSAVVDVLTSCCDLGDRVPYPGVSVDCWRDWEGSAEVCYASRSGRFRHLSSAISRRRPDAIYLNSMFSVAGTLWPLLRLKWSRHPIRIVLAPRGMLKPAALRQKALKKRLALWVFRKLRLMRGVVFHATSEEEVCEIHNQFPGAMVQVLPNVPAVPAPDLPTCEESSGPLKLCFVGRLHPIKNLHLVLEWLRQVQASCVLRIVGPTEDPDYVRRCEVLAASLPDHVRTQFEGAQSPERIQEMLRESDALILPTQGENFGHAIFEAFCVGTPVLISTATIWRDLRRRNAGWDLDLQRPHEFVEAIEALAKMDVAGRQQLRSGAWRLAREFVAGCDFRSGYLDLFFGDPIRLSSPSGTQQAENPDAGPAAAVPQQSPVATDVPAGNHSRAETSGW